MPTSRKRTKNKKKSKSSNKNLNVGPVNIKIKGNRLFLKNTLDKEEHATLMEKIKADRPLFYEELQTKIDVLIQKINNFDKIYILGGIVAKGLYDMIIVNGKDSIYELLSEYIQSAVLASSNDNVGKLPKKEDIDEVDFILKEIIQGFTSYYATEVTTEKYPLLESKIRFSVILQTMYVRGDGYKDHLLEVYKELFGAHDDFLLKHYGFSFMDIVEAMEQFEESLFCRLHFPEAPLITHNITHKRFVSWVETKKDSMDMTKHFITAFGEDNPDIIVENEKIVGIPFDSIKNYDSLYKVVPLNDKQIKVLNVLSLRFGENIGFFNPKFKAQPLNSSLIFQKPYVKIADNTFYSFNPKIAERNIFSIAENLIKSADKKYYNDSFLGNRVLKARDNYVERKTLSLLKKMIPTMDFYLSAKYNFPHSLKDLKCTINADGNYELDILGIGEEAILLVEVKAGTFGEQSKRGAIKSMSNDLSELVGFSSCQSYRAECYIESTEIPTFIDENGTNIVVDKQKSIYRISVTMAHLASLVGNLYDLKELKIIEEKVNYNWVISLFDLMIFSDFFNSEEELLDYLDFRLSVYDKENISIPDEIDLLGYYLATKPNNRKELERFNKLGNFTIANYSDEIDKQFQGISANEILKSLKNKKKPRTGS